MKQSNEEHRARLAAIRADLNRRAALPSVPIEEIDARLEAWRVTRDQTARQSQKQVTSEPPLDPKI